MQAAELSVGLCRTALGLCQELRTWRRRKGGEGMEAVKTQVASVIFGFLNRLITLLIYTVLILYF